MKYRREVVGDVLEVHIPRDVYDPVDYFTSRYYPVNTIEKWVKESGVHVANVYFRDSASCTITFEGNSRIFSNAKYGVDLYAEEMCVESRVEVVGDVLQVHFSRPKFSPYDYLVRRPSVFREYRALAKEAGVGTVHFYVRDFLSCILSVSEDGCWVKEVGAKAKRSRGKCNAAQSKAKGCERSET